MMKKVMCPRCWNHRQPFCDKCENEGFINDAKLSENFFLSEFTDSPTAREKRIPNDATIRQEDRLIGLCKNVLQPLRKVLGPMYITSGIRSLELNKLIKGALDSAHLYGYAADVQLQNHSLETIMHFLWENEHIKFDQAILEFGSREDVESDDWCHLGWKRSNGVQRRQFLQMRNGIYTAWTP
jgi:zinc D-Ala-D-Ala carboxypeptidase